MVTPRPSSALLETATSARIAPRLRSALLLALLLAPARALVGEPATVPGGAESIRRLLDLGSGGSPQDLFLDVNRILLAGPGPNAGWDQGDRRQVVALFVEDLEKWKEEQGCPALLSTRPAEWKRTKRALAWLGYGIRGDGPGFEAERRSGAREERRQAFLGLLGLPASEALERLSAGEDVTVACGDGEAEVPFGLAAWREVLGLDEKRLNAGNAFLHFVKNVRASRMLVALHGLDARTREEVRSLGGATGGYGGWRLLYDEALDGLALYPEGLEVRGGRIVLPGGPDADAAWEEVVGAPPAEPARFLPRFFGSGGGKPAYVADALRQLPEATARAFVLGRDGGGEKGVERFRVLYDAVGQSGRGIGRAQRDPYDFTQLAWFLGPPAEGDVSLPGGIALWREAVRTSRFPADEAALALVLEEAAGSEDDPVESLARLLGRQVEGAVLDVPAQKILVFVSGLVRSRPVLADPGTLVLLARGLERFLPAWAPLEDLPLDDPATVRRYLFTLNRLDTNGTGREAELRAGLFLTSTDLLAAFCRSGSLPDEKARGLFRSLLELPLFADAKTGPAAGFAGFDRWLHGELLAALRDEETRFLRRDGREPRPFDPEYDGPRPAPTADGLVAAALAGWQPPAVFAWRGGTYEYDATADGVARRRAFAQTQEHVPLEALAEAAVQKEKALASARDGDAPATREAVGLLLERLAAIPPGREADERVRLVSAGARFVFAMLQPATRESVLPVLEEGLGRLDALRAERTLEALVVHVYSSNVLDPSDLAFTDPLFVKRHSLSWGGPRGGAGGSPFGPARVEKAAEGGVQHLAGSFSGLGDVLGLQHAEGLVYDARSYIANDRVRAGLVAPVLYATPARFDDDAFRFVDLACRATGQLAEALAERPEAERHETWSALARDLVPASRRNGLAAGGRVEAEASLSPSDLFRIGRRLALGAGIGAPEVPAAREARETWERLVARRGAAGAAARVAELGPRPWAWAGRSRLADLEMPSYERLSEYRMPHLFADRLHDLKISAARAVVEAGDPAALLPLFLEPALDELVRGARMSHAFDWRPFAGAPRVLAGAERDEVLGAALASGRIARADAGEAR